MKTEKIKLKGIRDFNLTHIFECGQCFRWNKCEAYDEEDTEAYIGIVGSYVAKASMESADTMLLEVSGGDEEFWRNYFDLQTDYSKIKKELLSCELAKKTEVNCESSLEAAIDYGYGIRILNQDLFETLISFIISQNNNIPRIKKCIEALAANYGECLGEVFGETRFAFPSPRKLAQAPVCELAALKLGYRCEYIVQAAKRFLEEGAPTNYEQIINYLGIGPKVANCIRLFGLHEVGAFPIDTWVKHIMNDMYGFKESDVRGMSEFADKCFGSNAGYAQQYLFYYYRATTGQT